MTQLPDEKEKTTVKHRIGKASEDSYQYKIGHPGVVFLRTKWLSTIGSTPLWICQVEATAFLRLMLHAT